MKEAKMIGWAVAWCGVMLFAFTLFSYCFLSEESKPSKPQQYPGYESLPGSDGHKKPKQEKVAEKDPVLQLAWNIGFEFGQRSKASGLARPTESQVDDFALKAAAVSKVSSRDRGRFVTKFKSAFGWGYWAK